MAPRTTVPGIADAAMMMRPTRMHHAAWVTRDMEMTRAFYEDVLGLPLTACWIEKNPSTGHEYCHTCFEIGDGGSIAFFDWLAERDKPNPLVAPGHLALACDPETQAHLNVNAKNNEGETPLSVAEEKGHTEIVELLRRQGAKESR